MHFALAAALFVTLLPSVAIACMNTHLRHFYTYPLDFAHLGIAGAALILMWWRGYVPPPLDADEDDDVAAPSTEPSITRQFAILAVCATAGVGFGFFYAKVVWVELTPLLGWAVANLAMVGAAIGLSRVQRFGEQLVGLRRVLLVLAIVSSIFGASKALAGQETARGWGGDVNEEGEPLVVDVTF